ncbi:MAG TPA: hypothetical protein G4N96_04320 [Chloroflexi bacterium]|nr:hypothetical protein [Chloroflexota bacterium]
MQKPLQQLKEFNLAFGGYRQDSPTMDIPAEIKSLRIKLMREELAEVETAIANNNLLNLSKELSDLLYVLLGTVEAFGLSTKFPALFSEVHRSNMSKLDDNGKAIIREDGKFLKSKNYTKPDLEKVLTKNAT